MRIPLHRMNGRRGWQGWCRTLAFVMALLFSAPVAHAHENSGSAPSLTGAVSASVTSTRLPAAGPSDFDRACLGCSGHTDHVACTGVSACHAMMASPLCAALQPEGPRPLLASAGAVLAGGDVAPLAHPPKR